MLASTQISVAKPYGRFGQKLESLQGRSGPGTERVIKCRTGHGRGTDQKRQSKSRSERGQKAGQGMMGIVKYK